MLSFQLPPEIWSQAVYAWLPITLTHWRCIVQKEKCMSPHISICTWISLMRKWMFKSKENPQKRGPLQPHNFVWNEGKLHLHRWIWGLSCWHLYQPFFSSKITWIKFTPPLGRLILPGNATLLVYASIARAPLYNYLCLQWLKPMPNLPSLNSTQPCKLWHHGVLLSHRSPLSVGLCYVKNLLQSLMAVPNGIMAETLT